MGHEGCADRPPDAAQIRVVAWVVGERVDEDLQTSNAVSV
jgi:hypothetical protein